MDAETMLNEIINASRAIGFLDANYLPGVDAEQERLNAIRDQLLPLVRDGLALQRLDKWLEKSTRHECHCRWAVGEYVRLQFTLYDRGEADYTQKRPTLADAINAALDAAGEQS